MAYVSKSGKRRTVSPAKAQQFMRMADNWQNNYDRTGSRDYAATAAKQALVAAFYAKHAGDDVAAKEYLANGESLYDAAREPSVVAGDAKASPRTMKWIEKNLSPTRQLVRYNEGNLKGLRKRRHLLSGKQQKNAAARCDRNYKSAGFRTAKACRRFFLGGKGRA